MCEEKDKNDDWTGLERLLGIHWRFRSEDLQMGIEIIPEREPVTLHYLPTHDRRRDVRGWWRPSLHMSHPPITITQYVTSLKLTSAWFTEPELAEWKLHDRPTWPQLRHLTLKLSEAVISLNTKGPEGPRGPVKPIPNLKSFTIDNPDMLWSANLQRDTSYVGRLVSKAKRVTIKIDTSFVNNTFDAVRNWLKQMTQLVHVRIETPLHPRVLTSLLWHPTIKHVVVDTSLLLWHCNSYEPDFDMYPCRWKTLTFLRGISLEDEMQELPLKGLDCLTVHGVVYNAALTKIPESIKTLLRQGKLRLVPWDNEKRRVPIHNTHAFEPGMFELQYHSFMISCMQEESERNVAYDSVSSTLIKCIRAQGDVKKIFINMNEGCCAKLCLHNKRITLLDEMDDHWEPCFQMAMFLTNIKRVIGQDALVEGFTDLEISVASVQRAVKVIRMLKDIQKQPRFMFKSTQIVMRNSYDSYDSGDSDASQDEVHDKIQKLLQSLDDETVRVVFHPTS